MNGIVRGSTDYSSLGAGGGYDNTMNGSAAAVARPDRWMSDPLPMGEGGDSRPSRPRE